MLVWLDGRAQHAPASAGELRPRDHGAVHVRHRPLQRVRRVRGGARVHGVEPAAGQPWQRREPPITSSSSTPHQHDTSAKTFTFPIYRDGSRTIPARAAADGMQDGIDFITALATHPETGRRLARKLWDFFVSEVVEPDESHTEQRRRASTCRTARASSRSCTSCCGPASFRTRATGTPATAGRSSSSCARSRRLAGRASPWTRCARAADDDGPVAVRAARRQRLGSRPGMVHDGRHAGADELRGDDCCQSTDQPRAQSLPVPRARPSRCSTFFSSGCRLPRSICARAANCSRTSEAGGCVDRIRCAAPHEGRRASRGSSLDRVSTRLSNRNLAAVERGLQPARVGDRSCP